jgi:Uma2 family endonuclease
MSSTLTQPAPPSRHWIYADLEHFDESERYEIYDGKLISVSPSPSLYHQRLLTRLSSLLLPFLQQHPIGEVFYAPLDVVFSEDNTAQPDLLFISNENAGIMKDRVFGAPDLAVEILSPSSVTRDRYEKLEQYARFGVKEYWIIDQANRSVEILTLRDSRYVLHASAAEKGTVSSLVLTGLEFDVAQLF